MIVRYTPTTAAAIGQMEERLEEGIGVPAQCSARKGRREPEKIRKSKLEARNKHKIRID